MSTQKHSQEAMRSTRKTKSSSIVCNSCRKPISSTCYHVKCDCLFCEGCVFAHFADSDQCPSCGTKPLTERDFTELVISDTAMAPDFLKSCLQNVLVLRPNARSISFPEACGSMLRQMEAMKMISKFLLKQMLKDSSSNNMSNERVLGLEQENNDMKKELVAFRDMHQRTITELQNKLINKDKAYAELQKRTQNYEYQLRSSHGSPVQSPTMKRIPASRSGGPPLQGIIAQKQHREAEARAQHEAMISGRPALGSRIGLNSRVGGASSVPMGSSMGRIRSSVGGSPGASYSVVRRSNSYPGNRVAPHVGNPSMQRQVQQQFTPIQNVRPYTNNSNGTGNRIRELTATSGYNFKSTALNSNGPRINKRRRTSASPSQVGSPAYQSSYGNRSNPYA